MNPAQTSSQRGGRTPKKRPLTMTHAWERRWLDAERQLPLFGPLEMTLFIDLMPGLPTPKPVKEMPCA